MPPRIFGKRTKNPNAERRTKARHEGESSNPTPPPMAAPTFRLFESPEFKKIYDKEFLDKEVARGKVVSRIFCEENHLNTFKFFDDIGWGHFVSMEERLYPKLVRIFYAHLREEDNCHELTSFANDISITITKERLRTILEIDEGDFQFFSTHSWAHVQGFEPLEAIRQMCDNPNIQNISHIFASQLTLEARILHNVIGYLILPKSGSRTEVTCMEAFIIWCLLNKKRLDLSHIIYHHMLETRSSATQCYYALPLTKIFQSHGVTLSSEQSREVGNRERLNRTTLLLMKLQQNADGYWYDPRRENFAPAEANEEHDASNDEEGGGHVHLNEDAPAPMDDNASLMRQLISRFDEHITIARRTEEKVDTLRADFDHFQLRYEEEVELTGMQLLAIQDDITAIRTQPQTPPAPHDP